MLAALKKRFPRYIFNFEYVANPNDFTFLLEGLDLQPILQDKSGSLVCTWEHNHKEFIVWVDSEGSPCNAFAENMKDFLTILPFCAGLVYDYLSKYENHLLSPNRLPQNPAIFSAEYVKEMYIDEIEEKEMLQDYTEWLISHDLNLDLNPIGKIDYVMKNSKFKELHKN